MLSSIFVLFVSSFSFSFYLLVIVSERCFTACLMKTNQVAPSDLILFCERSHQILHSRSRVSESVVAHPDRRENFAVFITAKNFFRDFWQSFDCQGIAGRKTLQRHRNFNFDDAEVIPSKLLERSAVYGAKKPAMSMMTSEVEAAKRLKALSGPRPTVKWRLKTRFGW